MTYRIGVDTGGTFTDLCAWSEEGGLRLVKVPSTPDSPDEAVLRAVDRLGFGGEEIDFFGHGTTVGLNALIERKGAPTGLITTKGFRDVLEIARFNRPDMYNLRYHKPEPLVPRRLRLEVSERVLADGTVLTPLDEDDLRLAVTKLMGLGVRSVAVAFLNSYANPVHEERAAEILRTEFPDLTFSISTGHSREWREYERTSTTVLGAYLAPRTRHYVERLGSRLAKDGVKAPLLIVRCDGGLAHSRAAADDPVAILFSGPAAAVMGAAELGRVAGFPDLVTVDIGGTSCDVSLIRGSQPPMVTEKEVEGYPVQQQFVDVHSIGAGGGTIAWIDEAGLLKVGPRSAGAKPGPACYGAGGLEPAMTDAYVVLGYVDPARFLGGELPLDRDLAIRAFEPLADRLARPVEEVAFGAVTILNAAMAAAVRVVSVDRGYDPRGFALMVFGGAGPLHGVALARELGIRDVVVPRQPAHLAALGILLSDVKHSLSRTVLLPWGAKAAGRVDELVGEMKAAASAELAVEGFPVRARRFATSLEMRYAGQEHTLRVPVSGRLGVKVRGQTTGASSDPISERFHRLHQRQYSFALRGEACEVVAVRLEAIGRAERPEIGTIPEARGEARPAGERQVMFETSTGFVRCPVYERTGLGAGATVAGPAIIEEPASNTVVPPGASARIDRFGNIVVRV